jgi:hypothetical protein
MNGHRHFLRLMPLESRGMAEEERAMGCRPASWLGMLGSERVVMMLGVLARCCGLAAALTFLAA